jgi:hypothetical protein
MLPTQKSLPSQPFRTIAMGLSGGGYKAAGFHLGSLDYLNKVQYKGKALIESLEILSTVSGGTICGAYYAWHVQKGAPFEAFFRGLYRLMKEFDLIEAGLEKIHDTQNWQAHKNRNLINAFAQIYNEELFKGDTFGLFVDLEKQNFHLKEVIFNTTEFKYGLPFRFQNTGFCGNGKIRLTNAEMSEVALGDITAASSCFPSGFEPIAFPDDAMPPHATNLRELVQEGYQYHQLEKTIEELEASGDHEEQVAELKKQLKLPENSRKRQFSNGPIGLMDGGIVDNQGVEAILLSESRRRSKVERQPDEELERQIDLLIISDISSPYMSQLKLSNYEKANQQERTSNLVRLFGSTRQAFLSRVRLLGVISLIMGIALLVTFFAYWTTLIPVSLIFILIGGVLFSIGGVFLLALPGLLEGQYQKTLRSIRRKMGKPTSDHQRYDWKEFLPSFVQAYIPNILRIEFDTLSPMLLDRANSVVTMVTGVFMKQVRRLIYNKVYEDVSWEYRRISNFIYELRKEDHAKKVKNNRNLSKELRQPGSQITEAAAKATSMGVTLWFTEEEKKQGMIEHLIACGQFAMCFNLLEYLELMQVDPGYDKHPDKAALDQLHADMMKHWKAFREDPFFMLPKL